MKGGWKRSKHWQEVAKISQRLAKLGKTLKRLAKQCQDRQNGAKRDFSDEFNDTDFAHS